MRSPPAGRTIAAIGSNAASPLFLEGLAEHQRRLAAGHREVDVEQDLRVEQSAVQLAVRIVDAIALAERVETVALSRMHLARERQGVEHRAQIARSAAACRADASVRRRETRRRTRRCG